MCHTILYSFCFFFNDTATTEIYTLSLHDALPISIKDEETEEMTRDLLCRKHGLKKEYMNSVSATKWIQDKKELASHLRASDALIQPVFTPNLYGIATLEALSVEVPLISCEGELSFGTTRTEKTCLNAVERLKYKENVKNYLKRAKKTLKEKYSEDAFLKKMINVYEEALIPSLTT